MFRVASAVLMLLAGGIVLSAAPDFVPGDQTLPPTDINRESNNPAKAAIKAKEALEKEKSEREVVAAEAPAPQAGPVADSAQLARSVEAALRSDARTAKLGVTVQLDGERLIGLHGTVSSVDSRAAVISVATKVAGAARIKSYLEVRKAR
jgi:osmotically-inducible protein OsmY